MPSREVALIENQRMRLETFYAQLDQETASDLKSVAEAVRDRKALQVEVIVDIGQYLHKAKSLLNHGQFTWWLQQACAFSHRTALNYMHVADHFAEKSKMESVSNLKLRTLYRLAAPSTPAPLRDGLLKALAKNKQKSDISIMDLIASKRLDDKREKVLARFAHLPHPERHAALMEYYAEQAELRNDKEHLVQVRLQAISRLYQTLIGSGLDIGQLVTDMEEAGIPYLPAMLAERDPIPPGLRDDEGNLIRELVI